LAKAAPRPVAIGCGVALPPGARYAVLPLGAVTLVWEGHTEFASYTSGRKD
jgi:uncharacterized membrane-anchored protein